MQDKSTYLFAAESDADMEGWVLTFKKVLASNEAVQAQQDRFIRGEEAQGGGGGVRFMECGVRQLIVGVMHRDGKGKDEAQLGWGRWRS